MTKTCWEEFLIGAVMTLSGLGAGTNHNILIFHIWGNKLKYNFLDSIIELSSPQWINRVEQYPKEEQKQVCISRSQTGEAKESAGNRQVRILHKNFQEVPSKSLTSETSTLTSTLTSSSSSSCWGRNKNGKISHKSITLLWSSTSIETYITGISIRGFATGRQQFGHSCITERRYFLSVAIHRYANSTINHRNVPGNW
jgi:hypothetical protein